MFIYINLILYICIYSQKKIISTRDGTFFQESNKQQSLGLKRQKLNPVVYIYIYIFVYIKLIVDVNVSIYVGIHIYIYTEIAKPVRPPQ